MGQTHFAERAVFYCKESEEKMSFTKKTWVDRVSENPNRRTLTIISQDENTRVVDVARTEGEVSKEGDAFNAENMNDLESLYKGLRHMREVIYKVLAVKDPDSGSSQYIMVHSLHWNLPLFLLY